jgi:hypothetical protein
MCKALVSHVLVNMKAWTSVRLAQQILSLSSSFSLLPEDGSRIQLDSSII